MTRARYEEKKRSSERAREETEKWEGAIRHPLTTKFIDEFFADDFLRHRIAVATLRRRWLASEVPIQDIASGFWIGGTEPVYRGDMDTSGLNEHQHLEALLGYIRRLAFFGKCQKIDMTSLAGVLGSSFIWLNDFLLALATEIERQAKINGENELQGIGNIGGTTATAQSIRLVCSEIHA